MVLLGLQLGAGTDAPTCFTPEAALRYVDWRSYGLSYCGVYLIAADRAGPVKIGVSQSAEKRLAALQTAHWQRLHVFDYAWVKHARMARNVEQEAHAWLRDNGKGILGEWFETSVEQAYEALEWAAAALSIELHVEIPDHADVRDFCEKTSRQFRSNVRGADPGAEQKMQAVLEAAERFGRNPEREALKKKLGMCG